MKERHTRPFPVTPQTPPTAPSSPEYPKYSQSSTISKVYTARVVFFPRFRHAWVSPLTDVTLSVSYFFFARSNLPFLITFINILHCLFNHTSFSSTRPSLPKGADPLPAPLLHPANHATLPQDLFYCIYLYTLRGKCAPNVCLDLCRTRRINCSHDW